MLDNPIDIKVLNFFDITLDCFKVISKTNLLNKKYLLESFSSLLNEEEVAKVYMGWKEDGLYFIFDINQSFTNAFSDYRKGDSVEIFIDTRSLNTKGYVTKFCHHFVFFAEEIDGYKAMEVTRFRMDDMHSLCESKDLIVDSIVKPNSCILNIEIPANCLFGFNTKEINQISFAYRINRFEANPTHFSISSFEHSIEKSPHLWPKINFLEN